MGTTDNNQWLFTLDQIKNSPSSRDGIEYDSELQLRQFTALFILDLGTRISVPQLCLNTAIAYMHRFYMIHSFKKFHQNVNINIVGVSCLFLACKVEEHPTPLRKFIDAVQQLLRKNSQLLDPNSEEYKLRGEEIIAHESCLIQTLGFNVLINHAHTVIIKTCQMIKAPRDLAHTAYYVASNSLILTNFSIKYSCDKVACFCIYLACKWTGLKIPHSNEGRDWFQYVNPDITSVILEDICNEYIQIYDKCPAKIKTKIQQKKGENEDENKNSHSNSNTQSENNRSSSQQSLSSSKQNQTTASNEAKSYKEHVEQIRKQGDTSNIKNKTLTPPTVQSSSSGSITIKQESQQKPQINNTNTFIKQEPSQQQQQQHHKLQQPIVKQEFKPQHQQQNPQIKHNINQQSSINRNQNLKPTNTNSHLNQHNQNQFNKSLPLVNIKHPPSQQNDNPFNTGTTTTTTSSYSNGNHVKINIDENNIHQQKRSNNLTPSSTSSSTSTSMKRSNDDHSMNSAPNKIQKLVTEKTVS